MGLGYDLWVTTISDAIDNIEDIDTIMDAFGVVDNLTQVDFYKKYFYVDYDKVISLGVARAPCGTITAVQSEDYRKEVGDTKKIFLCTASATLAGSGTCIVGRHPSASCRY